MPLASAPLSSSHQHRRRLCRSHACAVPAPAPQPETPSRDAATSSASVSPHRCGKTPTRAAPGAKTPTTAIREPCRVALRERPRRRALTATSSCGSGPRSGGGSDLGRAARGCARTPRLLPLAVHGDLQMECGPVVQFMPIADAPARRAREADQ